MDDIVLRLQEPPGNSAYWCCRMAVERGEAIEEIKRLRNLLVEAKNERDIWRDRAMSK